MYKELENKCNEMIEILKEAKADCLVGNTSQIKDVKAESLLQSINMAINGIHHVTDTIKAYYTEE